MDKSQQPSNSEVYTPSSESFRGSLLAVSVEMNLFLIVAIPFTSYELDKINLFNPLKHEICLNNK
jgi:hypothetical protein